MLCQKCNEKFYLDEKSATIFFISEIDALVLKTTIFLKKLLLDFKHENGLISIQAENPQNFFSENLDAMKDYYCQIEKNEVKVFIDYDNNFNFQSALKAKSLQKYINLFDDKDFFDIVNNESLTTHFQPIVNIKENTIYGYEALSRGVKEDGVLMYPDVLFEKSQRNDFNFKLDRLCRETALKTAATKKVHQKVFINFIPTSIYDPAFCLKSTEKRVKQLEFDPSQIIFEVVETERIKDQKHLKDILSYYREKGFQIALDDVEEGYSSLNMLIELKPDIIKIDRNIISNIDKNELKKSVYKALFSLSREHNITILAEGVETAYELETIQKIGVDLVQGYYFAKPSAEPIRKIF